MAAVLLKQYVDALVAKITTAFSNSLANIQNQISNIQAGVGTGGPYLPLIGGEISGSLKVDGQMQVPTATIGDSSNNAASTQFVATSLSGLSSGGGGGGSNLSITYSDYVNCTSSIRALNTVYTNSNPVPLQLSITINDTYSLLDNNGPQFALLINGVTLTYFASTATDVFSVYGEVNPGETYEVQTAPGNLSILEYWYEKKGPVFSI